MSDLSWLNPTPHAIAVYASQPLSPVATQHSLPSGRYSLTWAGLPPAGSHQLAAGALIRSPRRRANPSFAGFVSVIPTARIAHLGRVDCCIHPPGRYETIAVTPPKIFPKGGGPKTGQR